MVSFCICFPGSTTVSTKQGLKRLDELLTSEEVLTFSHKQDSQKWTEFYTWGHREENRMAQFLVLKVGNGKELQISSEHLLFVAGHNGKRVAKKAGEIKIGDKLFYLNQIGMEDGNPGLEELPVVEITSIESIGVYAPFTMNGHFIANGFLVTSYASVNDFYLAHAALAPLRAWYRFRRNTSKPDAIVKEGIHGYALKLYKIREIFTSQRGNQKL